MTRRILVVAAHTDDETLGCGASIRRHVAEGDEVFALHLTNGIGARSKHSPLDLVKREEAANKAADLLGFEWIAKGQFPDNALDSVPLIEVIQFIEEAKQRVSSTHLYAHHGADLNVDHRVAFQAMLTACRPQPGDTVREIRTF